MKETENFTLGKTKSKVLQICKQIALHDYFQHGKRLINQLCKSYAQVQTDLLTECKQMSTRIERRMRAAYTWNGAELEQAEVIKNEFIRKLDLVLSPMSYDELDFFQTYIKFMLPNKRAKTLKLKIQKDTTRRIDVSCEAMTSLLRNRREMVECLGLKTDEVQEKLCATFDTLVVATINEFQECATLDCVSKLVLSKTGRPAFDKLRKVIDQIIQETLMPFSSSYTSNSVPNRSESANSSTELSENTHIDTLAEIQDNDTGSRRNRDILALSTTSKDNEKHTSDHVRDITPARLTTNTSDIYVILPDSTSGSDEVLPHKCDTDAVIPDSASNMTWDELSNTFYSLASKIKSSFLRDQIMRLRFVPHNGGYFVAKELSKRLQEEALQIDQSAFEWLICAVLDDTCNIPRNKFALLFGLHSQQHWLSKYVVLQLKYYLYTSQQEQIEFSKNSKSSRYKNQLFLLFLSQQLTEKSNHLISVSEVSEILQICENMHIDDTLLSQLANIKMSGWLIRLKWFQIMMDFQEVKIGERWTNDDVEKATYFTSELANRYGRKYVSRMMNIFKNKSSVDKRALLNVLHRLYRNIWTLDQNVLFILEHKPDREWLRSMQTDSSTESRSIDDLVTLMKRDDNNVSAIQKCLDDARDLVKRIIYQRSSTAVLTATDITDRIKNSEEVQRQQTKLNIASIIALIDQALYLTNGFRFRDTQLLSLVLFVTRDKNGLLQQISTGEGKSFIIAALAIIKAWFGFNVDILTSSSILARRDAKCNKPIYDIFLITVGHNCSEDIYERKASYVDNKVIYGEISSFQRDTLLNDFYDADNGIGSRKRGYILIDEVDSMLLDKGENVLYLSHEIPGMDALESLYVYIWNFVHAKGMIGCDDDIEAVVENTRSAMYATLRRSDLEDIIPEIEGCQKDELWDHLIEQGILNKEGKILKVQDISRNENVFIASKHISDDKSLQEMLLKLCKERIRQGVSIHIPDCLQTYVSDNLYQWVNNAFEARFMAIKDNYILDIDRSEAATTLDPNIIIIDKDTGVEQYNSQWSHGLHQFLQLKHGCRLVPESLKAVFMSNVSFFKQYSHNIFGLSGTLGSRAERDFLHSCYGIDYASIPTDKQSQFQEYIPRVCTSQDVWLKEIKLSVAKHKDRPILLICQNILDVEKIGSYLSDLTSVELYKHSHEEVIKHEEIDQPCILVCTNLAGRGTDIRISDRLNRKGGLHVCLTYLPANRRIEEQAYGRAARKGQMGSGQLICYLNENIDQLEDSSQLAIHLKVDRNLKEEEQMEKLTSHFDEVILPEETKFIEFKSWKSI